MTFFRSEILSWSRETNNSDSIDLSAGYWIATGSIASGFLSCNAHYGKVIEFDFVFFNMVSFKCRFDLNLHILAQAVLVGASM